MIKIKVFKKRTGISCVTHYVFESKEEMERELNILRKFWDEVTFEEE